MTSVVVVKRPCVSISYWLIISSVRSVEYHAELNRRYYVKSVPRSVYIMSVPNIDVTRTMREPIPAIVMDV